MALVVGVVVASTAAILIRVGQEAGGPSVALAAGRLTIASVILTVIVAVSAWANRHRKSPATSMPTPSAIFTRRDVGLAMISGAFLAVHFGSWFASLAYTSVASSAVFVTTTPIFVALIGRVWLREPLARQTVMGIVIAILGSTIIALADGAELFAGENPLLGDALALVGAMAAAAYLLIGRAVRVRMPLLPYIWISFGVAAIGLLVAAGVEWGLTGHEWPLDSLAIWAVVIGLAVGPQLVGHSSLNFALKTLPATFVAVALLGEPIGSMILAMIVLGDEPRLWQLVGCSCLLMGIFLASRTRRANTKH